MIVWILYLVDIVLSGTGWVKAAEHFEAPPQSPWARRSRAAAFLLLLISSGLFVSAAIAYSIWPRDPLNEALGWTAIVCLELCVLCGAIYATLNHFAASQHAAHRNTAPSHAAANDAANDAEHST